MYVANQLPLFKHYQRLDVLLAKQVTHLLISLGSNQQPQSHFKHAHDFFTTLGQVRLSQQFINPDFTATFKTPKPHYTNQCVFVELNRVNTLAHLLELFFQVENQCQRIRKHSTNQSKSLFVTLDIDVLALVMADDSNTDGIQYSTCIPQINDTKNLSLEFERLQSETVELRKIEALSWVAIQERQPLKAHEWQGINTLLDDK